MIKGFTVTRLFGDRDVSIPFESDVKILVAENGSGKTTLLNAIYNVVAGDFYKLGGLEFEEISIAFTTGVSVSIKKDDLELLDAIPPNDPRIHQYGGRLSPAVIGEITDMVRRHPMHMVTRKSRFRQIAQRLGWPLEHLYNVTRNLVNHPNTRDLWSSNLKGARDAIATNVIHQLLYFPTYRRIEEDLERLGFGEIDLPESDQLIKFGMNDVRDAFEKITAEIKNSSIEWFSKINGQMLTQLIDGIKITDELKLQLEKPEALKIVLDRIGENIGGEDKKHILDLLKSNQLNEPKFDPLVYFLTNLIKVYDEQKENDNAIKEFTSVCNNYLHDKEVVYNESRVSIEVVRKKTGEAISLGKLSSGEKQIISLFSKLYLETTRTTAVFFDEPELSLSIEWQRMLLPHIVKSSRCKFLLATTHSPFIFANELDAHSSDLTIYTKLL